MATITPDEILDLVSTEVPIDRAKLDASATLDSLDIASLDIISIVFALEDKFGVVLEQSEFEDVRTVSALVDLILGKTAQA